MNRRDEENYVKLHLERDVKLLITTVMTNKPPLPEDLPMPWKRAGRILWVNETPARIRAVRLMTNYLGYTVHFGVCPPAHIRKYGATSAILHEFYNAAEIAAWLLERYNEEKGNTNGSV